MPRTRQLLLALIAVLALGALPRPAAGCMLNPYHNFSPLPPCKTEDLATIDRLKQTNDRLVAKLTGVAMKVHEVRKEISMWQNAVGQSERYVQTLRRAFGELTASPVPSLIAEYNRESSLARFVKLNAEGGMAISAEPVDIVEVGDSLLGAYQDSVGVDQLYAIPATVSEMREEMFMDALAVRSELLALGEFQRQAEGTIDSLTAMGQRNAGRYRGVSTTAGVSEAKISNLSATLSRFRGTQFATQARAIQDRMEALEALQNNHAEFTRYNRRLLNALRGP